jgi:hypothetical protein
LEETIYNLWSGDRRVTWEEGAYQEWLTQKEAKKDALWKELKDYLWNVERLDLWRKENEKRGAKQSALNRLDQAVVWQNILGENVVRDIVNELKLPDSKGLWKKISQLKVAKGSVIHELGLAGMFRDELLGTLNECPVAHAPYLVTVIDTSAIKQMSVYCPIVDTMGTKAAIKIDPITQDTSTVDLEITAMEKWLGGGSIKNHGHIDTDGKKSWERKGR